MEDGGTHSRGRSVLRYGAELLVVFIGVWLSFVAEEWRRSRNDAESERASLGRIAEDLEADLEDLRFNLARANAGIEGGRALIDRTRRSTMSEDSVMRALSSTQFCSMFVENDAEYVALRNSGRLGLIHDAELRRSVVASYEKRSFLHSLHEDDCVRTETVAQAMAPHVMLREPPEAGRMLQVATDGFPDTSRPRVGDLGSADELFRERTFLNAVTALVARRQFLGIQIEATIDEVEAIRQELLARASRSP